MYTINDVKKLLGLSTSNQARNRIEAIKDLLAGEMRRGPNNQILLTDAGLRLLRRLQDLYDSGLTITQASEVMRSNSDYNNYQDKGVSPGFITNQTNAGAPEQLIAALRDEIMFLRTRVAFLEEQLRTHSARTPAEHAWWDDLREETDGT